MMQRLICLAILAMALLVALPAAADDATGPNLRRGVNLSNWLANAQRQPLFDHDFQQIKTVGFDHVRLPIDPEFLGFSATEAGSGRILFDFAPIDEALGLAMANGLSVILVIHPSDGFLSLVEQDARAEEGFVKLWQHIADHYKLYPSNVLAFEILNEPEYDEDTGRYSELMGDVVAALRRIVPRHLIIIDSPQGSDINSLNSFYPIKDSNVAYAFHFFEPDIFTRQGMNLGPEWRMIRYFRGLPYPSALVNPSTNYAPKAPDSAKAKKELMDYASAAWNEAHIRARIQLAGDWARANHARILCTEFGARRAFINASQRYQWIGDTRRALEADGIVWDLWDYTDLFGIVKLKGDTVTEPVDGSVRFVEPDKGVREIEPDAIKALFSK